MRSCVGFPENLLYMEFRRRYELLVPAEYRASLEPSDEKGAVEALLRHLDLETSGYKLGLSQVRMPLHLLLVTEGTAKWVEQRDMLLRLRKLCDTQ